MRLDIGDVAVLTGTFTDPETGDPADPNTVTCTVRKPDGDTATSPASGDAGEYTAEVDVDQAGTWRYAFDGTGGVKASGEGVFEVRPRQVPRS